MGTRFFIDPAPHYISVNLGVFLCKRCCEINQYLGIHTSSVKSVQLDEMDEMIYKVKASHIISPRYKRFA